MSFFGGALGGNPFSTPVGNKIELATDGSLASENWAMNMEICDLVNETEDGPKDAIRSIRKRLTQNAGKNYTVVMYTLIVLETCVKNCGRRFHLLACNKDFIAELVKLIGPKNDPPTAVQEKVLNLIQTWSDAFRHQTELSGVVAVYQDLVNKGIEFPATDLDAMAPIFTPQKSVDASIPAAVVSEHQLEISPIAQMASPVSAILTAEQRSKLKSELDAVQSNMSVFGEMLSELKPGNEHQDELELLQELNLTCRTMQERMVDLISKLSNDELTAELLRINDDLNNLFLRYSRWEKNHEAGGQSASLVLAKAVSPGTKLLPLSQTNDSLIDLGLPDVTDQLSTLNVSTNPSTAQSVKMGSGTAINGSPQCDEFDMFAQSRKVTYESNKISGSSYQDNLNPDQTLSGLSTLTQERQNSREADFDEMAEWLQETKVKTEESMTSSEFEKFLAERVAAAETLPNITTTNVIPSNARGNERLQSSPKDNNKDGFLA